MRVALKINVLITIGTVGRIGHIMTFITARVDDTCVFAQSISYSAALF